MVECKQGLAERAHKRADAIHHAEQYRLKAARLEVELEKAKGDLESQLSRQNLEKIVHDGLMKGVVCRPVLINFCFSSLGANAILCWLCRFRCASSQTLAEPQGV